MKPCHELQWPILIGRIARAGKKPWILFTSMWTLFTYSFGREYRLAYIIMVPEQYSLYASGQYTNAFYTNCVMLFRHSAKSLNAQEERLIGDKASPAARGSSEVARAFNRRCYPHTGSSGHSWCLSSSISWPVGFSGCQVRATGVQVWLFDYFCGGYRTGV